MAEAFPEDQSVRDLKAAIKGKIDGVARNVSPIFRDGERASFHPLSRDLLEAYDALVQSYTGIGSRRRRRDKASMLWALRHQ